MARLAEIYWFNPVSGEDELVNGVICNCYECAHDPYAEHWTEKYDNVPDGWYLSFTKSEYRLHQEERQKAYFAWKRLQAAKDGMARTKEKTEAEAVWEGRPVPTFFDINGDWVSPGQPSDRYLHSLYFRRMLQP